AFAVAAAAGGAKSTTSVDTASTYLAWAQRNQQLAGSGSHARVRSDVLEYLKSTPARFDLIVIDPPMRSMNRGSGEVFELGREHVALLALALQRLKAGGKIYFIAPARGFTFNEAALKEGREIR